MGNFVHLHVHSHYSLLDGLTRIPELVAAVRADGQSAVAITDHGSMYGVVEFVQACREAGVKPIVGVEAYLAPRSRHDREKQAGEKAYSHLILLAKNATGYQNLLELTTKAHLEGYYYKPRIDWELLAQYGDGLIALSGCMSGEIPLAIREGREDDAIAAIARYRERFGTDFYFELQRRNSIPDARKVEAALLAYAKRFRVPIVATNDVHYLKSDDAEAQDALLCLQTKAKQSDAGRLTMLGENYSLRTARDMALLFEDMPDAVERTVEIAGKCDCRLEFGNILLPKYDLPAGETADTHLRQLCVAGLERRYPDAAARATAAERLAYELTTIEQMGLSSYFCIVQDFVNWAKQRGIIVGPGRGSAAGSIVSYCTNITNLDPLAYGLLFERFLTPGRIQMPDIDIDFADHRRDEVIRYVQEKYGKECVAQIITFGTMAARASIRDAGRVLDIPLQFCDRIAKLIPMQDTLAEAVAEVPELRTLVEADATTAKLFAIAQRLEGVARHTSTHACGVVIAAEPLVRHTPIQHASADDTTIVTQYEMHAIESLGLLKMDFLGLSNLSIIEHAVNTIRARSGTVDVDALPLDDAATYALLQRGDSTGVFQLESGGMKRYLKELKPTEFEDIIAMVSLYRPGPMELIPEYIDRKFGRKPVTYLHPRLEHILKPTYGILVYQEQLMSLARDLAGFTMAEADTLRKAVGKKIKSLLDAQRTKLTNGMIANSIMPKIAEKIWEWIEPFARYGFNRCVTADTMLCDSSSGRLVTIGELARGEERLTNVFALGQDQKIVRRAVAKVWRNGRKQVFKVRTKSGREIRVTANHPFYTFHGWRTLEELTVGERIGVPRSIPIRPHAKGVPAHQLAVLGYLIAEGNLCHPHGFYFYSTSEEELRDYSTFLKQFENTKATYNRQKSAASIYAGRIDTRRPSEAVEWIRGLGLYGMRATTKMLPNCVFTLSLDELAVVIGKMFQGDGSITIQHGAPSIFYATSSERLARQLQHLLLRYDILSTIHEKRFAYRGTVKSGYTLSISRFTNIARFLRTFERHFVGSKRRLAAEILRTHPIINGSVAPHAARGSYDVVPAEVRTLVRVSAAQRYPNYRAAAAAAGLSWRLFLKDERRGGYLRETIERMGEAWGDDVLCRYARSDVFWDRIASIERAGIEETYDLTIVGDHNFTANDIFVHNSHAACYAFIAYQTAYLKAHFPAEFMAALLTAERGDTDRLSVLIQECRGMGIAVLGPDINESEALFTVANEANGRQPIADSQRDGATHAAIGYRLSAIRFGLAAIKNVGEHLIEALVAERKANGPYGDLADLLERVQDKDFNKKSLECLIQSGCLDRFGERGQLLANVDALLAHGRGFARDAAAGQANLFGGIGSRPELRLASAEPAPQRIRLTWEKSLLGLYLTSHPFAASAEAFGSAATPIAEVRSGGGRPATFGGAVTRVKQIMTKKGEPMGFAEVEDATGAVEVVVFPRVWSATSAVWLADALVLVRGNASEESGTVKVLADRAVAVVPGQEQDALHLLGGAASSGRWASPGPRLRVTLALPAGFPTDRLAALQQALTASPGRDAVDLRTPVGRIVRTGLRMTLTPDLRRTITNFLGEGAIMEEALAET